MLYVESNLHSAGIYHRDLKPANCLVNTDCCVKICDFGLSRALGGDIPQEVVGAGGGGAGNRVLRRQLTGHVVTRWYRAPELILLQEDYDDQIDVWSLGCIFAELLGMIRTNIPIPSNRAPLFQGGCCFPLSPDRTDRKDSSNGAVASGNRDQLNLIFNVLGTPSEASISRFPKEDTRRYLRCFKARQKVALNEIDRFKHSSPEALDLLEKMLVFSPQQRITVDQALNHPCFDKVRRKEEERIYGEEDNKSSGGGGSGGVPGSKIELEFESEPELDENRLRMYFIKEIQRYHPQVQMPIELKYF